jgi:superfamily I DNA and RNA helicase
MVNIIRGTTKKPVSSQRLAEYFSNHHEYDGYLYIGYPIIGTAEGAFPIDALWVSKEKGLVAFDIIEGLDTGDFEETQDDIVNKLDAKLRGHRTLMDRRQLQVTINALTFAPVKEDAPSLSHADFPVCNESNLKQQLDAFYWPNNTTYEELVAVIQSISTIRKGRKKRFIISEDSRGAKLKRLEDSIANLDNLQGRAVIETVDGVQRIRGLAGSGKTIVLALKAAYLHAQHPDWKIAITFNSRSLKGQFKQLINTFAIEQTNEEPDWSNLQIIHAWGAPGGGDRNGIYYSFCSIHGLEYYDYSSAKNMYGRGKEFDGACQKALNEMKSPVGLYDAILIDEAQDFPASFLRLCYEMLNEDKRLVYAYDELQILNSQSMGSPEDIFGKKTDGSPRVSFLPSQPGKPQQDIILEKCYRNSRPVLVTAHALGFGVYREPDTETGTGLVQMFERKQLWLDVGYVISDGTLNDGKEVILERTDESSPGFLENHSQIEDIMYFHCFASKEEQDEWVAGAVIKDIEEEELRPDDIIIINPNPLTTRSAVGEIRSLLFEKGINSHLAGVDTTPDIFFETDTESVAFTGIHRAKGNEAGMVYIINAQDCYSSYGNAALVRNRLFTAITRSKSWVRVLGYGDEMKSLMNEYDKVKENDFKLKFTYPTEEQRKHLKIINRDLTTKERRRVKKWEDDIVELIEDLEAGNIYPEDLGTDKLKRLRKYLDKVDE